MGNLILIAFLLSGFTLKWNVPKGTNYSLGMLCIGDTDRDGNYELIFHPDTYGQRNIYYCELMESGAWQIDSFYSSIWEGIWELADFDNDGLFDLLVTGGEVVPPCFAYLGVLESPDSFSYPTQEVWRDTACDTISGGGPDDSGYDVFDIDGDGLTEILGRGDGLPNWFWIWENTGNNQYVQVFGDNPDTTLRASPHSTHACGDFDGDGKNEFVMGAPSSFTPNWAWYWVYESPASNIYEKVIQDSLVTKNIKDCFVVADADRDGKKEFVVKGNTYAHQPPYTISAFVCEAVSDNTYGILKAFAYPFDPIADYWGGHSDAGDVDGDSVPEIVLEACSVVPIIKAAGNDSFYVWYTLPGNMTGSHIRVFDLDRNGLNEILISGNNQTRIYEKTPEVTWFCPHPPPADTFCSLDTVTLHWQLDEMISLYSLRLYWAHPQLGCHLIYQGSPIDTLFQWVVPDTQSNIPFKICLAVSGDGRYDSINSPPFYVKRTTGINDESEHGISRGIDLLDVFPNPFKSKTNIRFTISMQNQKNIECGCQKPELKIYDVTGKLVKDLTSLLNYPSFNNRINWDGSDDAGYSLPRGVYFVHLTTSDNLTIIRKIIKLK